MKWTRPMLVTAAFLLMAGCERVEITTVEAARIEVSPSTAHVQPERTVRLAASVMSSDGRTLGGREVHWSSPNPDIAVVAQDGTVTGVAPGTVLIEASAEGLTATATVVVSAPPAFGITPTSIQFTGVRGGASPGDRTVSISNTGDDVLSGLSVRIRYASGAPSGWLNAELAGTSAPTSLVLSADQAGLSTGTYSATVEITAASSADTAILPVALQVIEPAPFITLSAAAVEFNASEGGSDPDPRTVTIANGGGGNLNSLSVSVEPTGGADGDWLVATLNRDVAPATLTLRARTGDLDAGTYTANVRIESPSAQNSPQTLPVTLTVGSPLPILSVDPAELVFDAFAGSGTQQTKAVQVANAGGGSLTGLSLSVTFPGGQPVGWLDTSLEDTEAPTTLAVSVAPGSLQPGTYTATIRLTATGLSTSAAVDVRLQVTDPPPAIAVSPGSVTFQGVAGGPAPGPETVQVTNGGGGTLTGLSASIDWGGGRTGWLEASLSGTTAPAALQLTANQAGLDPGTYTATVRLTASGAENSASVSVRLEVAEPQSVITLSPTTVSFEAAAGGTAPGPVSVQVTNSGGGTLTGLSHSIQWGSGATGWLDASLASTSAPTVLQLTASPTGLGAGTYTATVTVSASGVSGSASVEVSMTVSGGGPAPTPTGLSAVALDDRTISVSWTDEGTSTESFVVERTGGGSSDWNTIANPPASVTAIVDTVEEASSTYGYRVSACTAAGCSAPTQSETTTTAPAAPSGLDVTLHPSGRYRLSWSDNSSDETAFLIERRVGSDNTWHSLSVVVNSTNYFDDDIQWPLIHRYRVRACRDDLCSAPSNVASIGGL